MKTFSLEKKLGKIRENLANGKAGFKKHNWYENLFHKSKLIFKNMEAANYEITRRLSSLSGCQTTSYLVFAYIKKSSCRFLQSFLKIAEAFNV